MCGKVHISLLTLTMVTLGLKSDKEREEQRNWDAEQNRVESDV